MTRSLMVFAAFLSRRSNRDGACGRFPLYRCRACRTYLVGRPNNVPAEWPWDALFRSWECCSY